VRFETKFLDAPYGYAHRSGRVPRPHYAAVKCLTPVRPDAKYHAPSPAAWLQADLRLETVEPAAEQKGQPAVGVVSKALGIRALTDAQRFSRLMPLVRRRVETQLTPRLVLEQQQLGVIR
jgi:hypothetical protein